MTPDLRDRLALAIFLIPFASWFIAYGRGVFLLGCLGLFALAVWELGHMFKAAQQRPALPLMVVGVLAILLATEFASLELLGLSLGATVVAAWVWHTIDYERGAPSAATDCVITIGSIFFIGGLGRYFIILRALPDGLWWLLATFGAVWMADTGAYLAGKQFGRHPLAPRLSPKKTWEGYVGGIVVSALSNAVFCLAWQLANGPDSAVNWFTGALLGIFIGALSPLGDLGISLFKRQVGLKDSGDLLGSHGGVLDRIDSWFMAGFVAYYFALLIRALPF